MSNSPLRIIQADFTGDNVRQGICRSNRRTFKACRKCRELKLQCEGHNDPSDHRCKRCITNSLECIFDLAGSKGKRVGVAAHEDRPKRRRRTREYFALDRTQRHATGEVEVQVRTPAAIATSTTSQVPDTEQRRRSSPAGNEGGIRQAPADFTRGLTSHNLRAPVSAVHHMSTPEERSSNGTGHMVTSQPIETQPRPVGTFGFLNRMETSSDIMSRGLIEQWQARRLFNLFMSGAGNFMPIFDSVIDTFDSLRLREPFCFTVILALASCIEQIPDFPEASKSMLQDEVKKFIAQSLFKRPATLGSVQAMLLLAAYTDEAWFAIGHALQMAKDLKLDCALQSLVATSETQAIPFKEQKHLMRKIRIWLALCFIEREIAAGIATSSRIAPVDIGLLRKLRSHPLFTASDLRATSLVEIVQIRENFQQEISRPVDLQDTAVDRLMTIEKEYVQWLELWDNIHDEYGFDKSSFQRASLQGQKNWAVMFTGCTILGRLKKETGVTRSSADELEGPSKELVIYIVSIVMEQLRSILQTSDYRWNLRWATNYSALSVTFAVIFVLNAARVHSQLFNRAEVLATAQEIAQILQFYPHPHFYRLIRLLITLTANESLPRTDIDLQSMAVQHNNSCTQQSIHQEPDRENEPPQHPRLDLSLEKLLDEHLQNADWLLKPSSITALNLLGDWNSTILDQNLCL